MKLPEALGVRENPAPARPQSQAAKKRILRRIKRETGVWCAKLRRE
jgi:hypothetical protein